MWTQLTMARLVRWRIRDWASCFLACRFPIVDEPERYSASKPKLRTRNVVFDAKIERRGERPKRRLSKSLKCESQMREIHVSAQSKDCEPVEKTIHEESSWTHFADEDFIVFCFREDGNFDVVRDGKQETPTSMSFKSASSRSVSWKLNYGGDGKAVKRCSTDEERLTGDACEIYPTNDENFAVPHEKAKEDDEEGSIEVNIKSPERSERGNENVQGANGGSNSSSRWILSTGSSDSTQSDISTGSFAFPVLSWEWTGSPVQMPRSEVLQLRKHKARCVGFQCCRF